MWARPLLINIRLRYNRWRRVSMRILIGPWKWGLMALIKILQGIINFYSIPSCHSTKNEKDGVRWWKSPVRTQRKRKFSKRRYREYQFSNESQHERNQLSDKYHKQRPFWENGRLLKDSWIIYASTAGWGKLSQTSPWRFQLIDQCHQCLDQLGW